MTDAEPFEFEGTTVEPGEARNVMFPVSESYLGESVNAPVTVVNGERAGPTVLLTAAIHGDELNGIAVVREVAGSVRPAELAGTLVCLPVVNPHGFLTQQRYLPVQDRDLNRAFPGAPDSTSSKRIAYRIFTNFVEPTDYGLDFHTSTRGRTNMFHVRADMTNDRVARLARAFGSNMIIDSEGSDGMLRHEATKADVPTITVEMGEAHRFERRLIDHAVEGVSSVLAEYGLVDDVDVRWPGWRTVVSGWDEKTWLRADTGGIVEMHERRGALVEEGEPICTIADPFDAESVTVRAPFTGLIVGVLENPVVYPGNPLCHLASVDDRLQRAIELVRSTDESPGRGIPAEEE